MEKVSFHIQSTKKKGLIKVRYRLTDGRAVQFSHKTDIKCTQEDLDKLNPDGTTTDRVQIYNQELSRLLKAEHKLMLDAYALMKDTGLDMTSEVFEREITKLRSPLAAVRIESPNVVTRFRKYADNALRDGILGKNRHKHINVVADKLERFLIIKGISGITAEEFGVDQLMEFREFLYDEYLYVDKYKKLYETVNKANKPQARLSMNTVVSQMKMLQTFFNELENSGEIVKTPFRMMSKEKRKRVMRTMYDEPFFLRKEELKAIIAAKVPERFQDTKDAFLVQCALGCRIGDFVKMGMNSIAVSDDGIPYVRYIPKKTVGTLTGNEYVKTPLVRFAFDIIMRKQFSFPIIKNAYGEFGYNAMIKGLLQMCKIDREVAQFNEATEENEFVPLYKVGSSKLARKTHVDIMNKVQVDMYAAGLHKQGSSAVNRYTALEMKDRFALMNAAFEQEPFKVNEKLDVL